MKFREWLRSLGTKGVESALLGLITLILTAIIKGEPPKGLVHLTTGDIPLWSLGSYSRCLISTSIAWLQKRSRKGRGMPGLAHYRPTFNDYNYESQMNSQDLLLVFNDGNFLVGRGRVDPDGVGQGRVLRRFVDEALGMTLVGEIQHGLPPRDQLSGLAIMHRGGREQVKAGMVMLVVVPRGKSPGRSGAHPGWSRSGPGSKAGISWF